MARPLTLRASRLTETYVRNMDKAAFLRASVGYPAILSDVYLISDLRDILVGSDTRDTGLIHQWRWRTVSSPAQSHLTSRAMTKIAKNAYPIFIGGNQVPNPTCLLSPQPASNLDVSETQALVSVVNSHPEVRLATRDDNPFSAQVAGVWVGSHHTIGRGKWKQTQTFSSRSTDVRAARR